jgi:hypothetical protein
MVQLYPFLVMTDLLEFILAIEPGKPAPVIRKWLKAYNIAAC